MGVGWYLQKLQTLIGRRLYLSKELEGRVVDQFHAMYFDLGEVRETWRNTQWLGVGVSKLPLDLWVYQEIIYDLRPSLIIEAGTALGGSALFLASMCNLIQHGSVITIDIKKPDAPPDHPRITYVTGSSVSEDVISEVRSRAEGQSPVMVILDSDHSQDHVLKELALYGPLVTKDSYLIVEDTNLNGHPVLPEFGPGPMEAVQEFLSGNSDFIVDKSREKFLVSFNPGGYLKRVNTPAASSEQSEVD